jgi:hypothetical protein
MNIPNGHCPVVAPEEPKNLGLKRTQSGSSYGGRVCWSHSEIALQSFHTQSVGAAGTHRRHVGQPSILR